MLIEDKKSLGILIEDAAASLDVPDHVYEDAIVRYEDIAEYLSDDSSDLASLEPKIYPQGSFRLGTVISPYDNAEDYDIDLVCRLSLQKTSTTQADLKKRVGDRLKERTDLNGMLEESRRCWRLNYPSENGLPRFHVDVLPAIPADDAALTDGINITDKELHRWQFSNPIAYADWFVKQMEVVFRTKRLALAETSSADIEDVPIWQVKTPLQRSVQILKRHRDIYFEGDPEDRPISIIITTLAAHAYRNEENIYDALLGIAERMHLYIEDRNGTLWVENPVEPNENFADKWNEFPTRKAAFEKWLLKVRQDFTKVGLARSQDEGRVVLSETLSRSPRTSNAIVPFQPPRSRTPEVPEMGSTTHVVRPDSKFVLQVASNIRASLRVDLFGKGKRKKLWQVTTRPVPTQLNLKFTLKTNAPRPYTVKWQVTNTGKEAAEANQLRGDFYDSDEGTQNTRWESTAYKGTHWVEAFILDQRGVCVARTGRFEIKIR